MHIRSMNATFGKLEQAELQLQPGLNVIYAPNESGKSTWCRFIRNMFYGLNTRDRGALADKNRYAPWSGAAMHGRMDLTVDGADYTLSRNTRRANSPMGDFSCTYSDTATPVPGITAQNAGEELLGVSREVFERSAFIGQAALAVDQDAELERRIAALITTGEEDTSYSEAYERLKKQLNRRKHNKTGQIPALEREIDGLDASLTLLEDLQAQHRLTAGQLERSRQQLTELQEQQKQWDLVEQQEKWQQYRKAEQLAVQARQKADTMAELAGNLPDGALLSRLEAQQAALANDREELQQARQAAEDAAAEARRCADTMTQLSSKLPEDTVLTRFETRSAALAADRLEAEQAHREAGAAAEAARKADESLRAQPLYPADEQGLRDRLDQMTVPTPPPAWPFPVCLALGLIALAAAAVCLALGTHPVAWIAAAAGAAGLVLSVHFKKKQNFAAAEHESVLDRRRELEQQTEEYLPLRQAARDAADEARRTTGLADTLERRFADGVADLIRELSPYRVTSDLSAAAAAIAELRRQSETLVTARKETRDAADEARRTAGLADTLERRFADGAADLIRELSPYRATSDLSAAAAAIAELRRQSEALAAARKEARDAELQLEYLRKNLPEEVAPDVPLPQPAMTRAQVEAALPRTAANLQAAQSRLDTLTGQIRSMGDPDDLLSRRSQKAEELERLQDEYHAISLAMEALESANLTLQNRFSPALGARAAEIFSGITGGKYQKVLLSRDFSLAAEPSDDATARSIQLLSQGAADQLYLSVRLAICDMVLPRDKAVPLILDDALISFDDDRLHAALDYLLQESERRQILLFTCQKREQEYLAGQKNAALISL